MSSFGTFRLLMYMYCLSLYDWLGENSPLMPCCYFFHALLGIVSNIFVKCKSATAK